MGKYSLTIKNPVRRDLPSLSLRLDIAPVVSGNVALIGLSNGQLLAIDTQIGRALWDLPISLPTGVNELERMRDIAGQPLVDQTTVFLNNFQGDIASVDGRNRRVNWSKKISSHQQMSGDGSAIYTTASDSSIVALRAKESLELLFFLKIKTLTKISFMPYPITALSIAID